MRSAARNARRCGTWGGLRVRLGVSAGLRWAVPGDYACVRARTHCLPRLASGPTIAPGAGVFFYLCFLWRWRGCVPATPPLGGMRSRRATCLPLPSTSTSLYYRLSAHRGNRSARRTWHSARGRQTVLDCYGAPRGGTGGVAITRIPQRLVPRGRAALAYVAFAGRPGKTDKRGGTVSRFLLFFVQDGILLASADGSAWRRGYVCVYFVHVPYSGPPCHL